MSDGNLLAKVGLKPGENVGVSAIALFGTLPFVESSGRVSSGQEVLRRALAGETIIASTELRGTTFENRIDPKRDSAGTIVGVVGVAIDITERVEARRAERRSEMRFRAIFDRAPMGIALTDVATGRFVAVNPEFARIVARAVDDLMRRDWMSITHPEDLRQELDNMTLLNAGTISSFQMEKRHLHLDGTSIWGTLTVAAISGAVGYLIKDSAALELDQAIEAVMRGERYLSPPVSHTVVAGYLARFAGGGRDAAVPLTPRQSEVLTLVATGKSIREIARALKISVKTVESHRQQLMKRLDIHTVRGLVRYAASAGFIPPVD